MKSVKSNIWFVWYLKIVVLRINNEFHKLGIKVQNITEGCSYGNRKRLQLVES